MMEQAKALLEELVARQADPGAPGFWRDFLVGMLKPAAATAGVAMAVALSFSQRLGLEGEMLYAIARAFLHPLPLLVPRCSLLGWWRCPRPL